MLSNNAKLNFRIGDVIQAGFSVAKADGGFVIAIQIINFLLMYFGVHFSSQAGGLQTLASVNKSSFFIALITILNLAVIIYRIAGLARGMKYSPLICYQQAFRRGPLLIILYFLGAALTLCLAIKLLQVTQNHNLVMFLILSLTPIGMFSCIYIVDQEKNLLQALTSTFKTITNNLSFNLLINLALLYSLPFCIGTMFVIPASVTPYVSLFNDLWMLFCHILVIVIYSGMCVKLDLNPIKEKATKVIVI